MKTVDLDRLVEEAQRVRSEAERGYQGAAPFTRAEHLLYVIVEFLHAIYRDLPGAPQ